MWPRALAQLIELLPHITRLVPVADRFLSARTEAEESSRRVLEQLAHVHAAVDGLRAEVGQTTASHDGLYRQMNETAAKADEAAREARAAREQSVVLETRLRRLERGQSRLMTVMVIVLVLLLALVVVELVRR